MSTYTGFTDTGAKTYDERVRKHIPGYEVLHGLSEVILAGELLEKASILAVGTGTGHEILDWAPKHPAWSFLGTDKAPAMLELAKNRTVVWGDETDSDTKSQVATALLRRAGTEIDVSAPSVVTIR